MVVLKSLSFDRVNLCAALFRSRAALVAENLFPRKQLALFQERKRKAKPTKAADRFVLCRLAPLFDWRPGRRGQPRSVGESQPSFASPPLGRAAGFIWTGTLPAISEAFPDLPEPLQRDSAEALFDRPGADPRRPHKGARELPTLVRTGDSPLELYSQSNWFNSRTSSIAAIFTNSMNLRHGN